MTIFLTNWSSRMLHGPGPRLTIMARPREWEHGDGAVISLIPNREDFDAVRSGELGTEAYLSRYAEGLRGDRARRLAPGELSFRPGHPPYAALASRVVPDGATLCCGCSVANADVGLCHRVPAAEALRLAGWRVWLDGRDLGAPTLFG